MKGKTLLTIAVISALSSSAFATEVVKGKLISHKEWSTGKSTATAIFKDAKRNPSMRENLKGQSNEAGGIFVTTWSKVLSDDKDNVIHIRPMGQKTSFEGYAEGYIYNNSGATRLITLLTGVCTDTQPVEVRVGPVATMCHYSESGYVVDAGGYIAFGQHPVLERTYDKPGTYPVAVTQMISIDEELGRERSAVYANKDFGTIKIMELVPVPVPPKKS